MVAFSASILWTSEPAGLPISISCTGNSIPWRMLPPCPSRLNLESLWLHHIISNHDCAHCGSGRNVLCKSFWESEHSIEGVCSHWHCNIRVLLGQVCVPTRKDHIVDTICKVKRASSEDRVYGGEKPRMTNQLFKSLVDCVRLYLSIRVSPALEIKGVGDENWELWVLLAFDSLYSFSTLRSCRNRSSLFRETNVTIPSR